ncbi:PHO85 cyclin-6 [Kluyveromyces marxianus]
MSYLDNAPSSSYAETEPIEIPIARDGTGPFSSSLQESHNNSDTITTSTRLIDSSNSSIDHYGSTGLTPQEISHNAPHAYFDSGDSSYIKHTSGNSGFLDSSSGISSSVESGPNLRRRSMSTSFQNTSDHKNSLHVQTQAAVPVQVPVPVKSVSELRSNGVTRSHSVPPQYVDGRSENESKNKSSSTKTHSTPDTAKSANEGSGAGSHHMDIATFPTDELLDMLTKLLTKIINSNDALGSVSSIDNPNLQGKNIPLLREILSFRGKQVPGITLKQYFERIQKYCPTTNDVLLSLLVHFDRIAKKCNSIAQEYMTPSPALKTAGDGEAPAPAPAPPQQLFVMDSHNIHRLIIAAITVSTKFISDFFYSNSRYARVGGISLQELNHLELQFLILCDFRLIISVEELQRYADLLYKFWDKETSARQALESNKTQPIAL